MSNINQIKVEEEIGKLRQAFEESLGGKGLGQLEREAIAVAVSVSNECDYCIQKQVDKLRSVGGSEDLIERLKLGEEPEDQSERLVRLVYYSRKLTLLPGSVGKQDIAELREVGLTDLEIMQAVQVVGYVNYVNRMANGLGVEAERIKDKG
jgi:uncharacterized peroxidase-related enzyme